MKRTFPFFLFLILTSCVSIKEYNEKLETPISIENSRHDIDFAYKKLQKLHPKLYWYISKEDLDYKFDSLKSSINKPLTPPELYLKLAPVIAQVREGHLRLVAPEKRLTKKQRKNLEYQKGLFGRMNYVVDGGKIFVLDNAEKFEGIAVGTEITKIKDIPVSELLEKYKPFINSDGYNTTFQKYSIARRWPVFFTLENGILDSVKIETKFQNKTKTFYIHREKITKKEKKEKEAENKKISKTQTGKTRDYNITTKSYNRDLQFPIKDSTIAYMKVKTFSGTYSKRFYKESFAKIKKAKSSYLILDIRNNLGGSLSEINNLYSYLAKDKFQFINDIEVTSGSSMFHADYFNHVPKIASPIAVITYPLYFIGTWMANKSKDGHHYLRNNNWFSVKNPKKNAFQGKIYILINGSSFSAASILPSKIKGDHLGKIIGEETGGANDGTVAGRWSTEKLPYSKLKLPIGLMFIQPDILFTGTKKGVVPDVEIAPSLQETLLKKDVQMDWIMSDIAADKKNSLAEIILH